MKKALLAAALIGAFASASAETNTAKPFYLSLGAGTAHMNYSCEGGSACRNNDTGYKVVAGWRLQRNLALELGYANYGKHIGEFPPPAGLNADRIYVAAEAAGWNLGAAYSFQIARQLDAIVRGGLALNRSSYSITAYSGDTPTSAFQTENKAALYLGAGVAYRLHDTASLFADLDLSYADDGVNGSYGVRLLSAGVKLDF